MIRHGWHLIRSLQRYEQGMTIMEIVDQGEISRRTAYRYKAYYEELNKRKSSVEKLDDK